VEAGSIVSGSGYLVKFDQSFAGKDVYFVSTETAFPVVYALNTPPATADANLKMWGNPLFKTLTILTANKGGNRYYRFDGSNKYSELLNDVNIPPFSAYIVSNGTGHSDIVPAVTPFTISAGATVSASTYDPLHNDDIIFKGNASNPTATLNNIPSEGLQVKGVVKVEKTLEPHHWYALGFPFALDKVYCDYYKNNETRGILSPWDGTDGDYWLMSYNGNAFVEATEWTTGEGYIIETPNAIKVDGTTRPLTFISAHNPTLFNNAAIQLTNDDEYTLTPNPSVNAQTLVPNANDFNYYRLNSEGTHFGRLTANATLAPFESVIAVKNATNLRSAIAIDGSDIGTAIELPAISTQDPVIATRYYNLQGVEVKLPIENSVYIEKRTHASQTVDVRKVLYKN
jgi:hypothetical protein